MPAPVAKISVTPKTCTSPNGQLYFESASTGKITSYLWTFGDGTSSASRNPGWHQFGSSSSYTVKLKVTGPGGSRTASVTIKTNC